MAQRKGPGLLTGLIPLMVAGGLACGGGGSALDLVPSPTAAATTGPQPTQAPAVSPTAEAQPTEAVGGQQEYTVQAGDTLGAIAAQFGVTVDAIAQLNEIADPNLIVPGETLIIPAAE